MSACLIDGERCASLAVSDRAIHYGDGLFETIAVRDGRIEYWQRHMQRLAQGCQRLNMPALDAALLLSEARQLIGRARQGIIKIIVSRGAGGRGYRPPPAAQPRRICAFYPWPQYSLERWQQGIVLTVCKTPLGLSPALAGMKHLNRLEQIMGRSEWCDDTIAEGLMLDIHGNVVEGTMSNLFFVRDGQLHTPGLANSGVAGIIRDVIMDCCQALNIPVYQNNYPLGDVIAADELFVTNSVIGVWPVKQLAEKSYYIGPLTQQLQQALNKHQQQQGEYETVA